MSRAKNKYISHAALRMVTGDSEPTSKAQLVRQALNVGKGKAGEIDWKAMYEQIEKMKAKSPSSEPASVMHSVYSDSATTVNYDTASEPKDAEEVFIGGLPATHSAFTSADDVSYFEEETVAKDVELGASTDEEEEDFFSYNDPSARDRLSVIIANFVFPHHLLILNKEEGRVYLVYTIDAGT